MLQIEFLRTICQIAVRCMPQNPTDGRQTLVQGWGLLSQFPLFLYFPNFSASPEYMLAIEYHVHIWQVSLQLSCGDTCQIWMWCKEFNRYFDRIENFAYGEINERNFSNLHPRYWVRVVRQHIDGLVQDSSISSALAMEILQSCTRPSISSRNFSHHWFRQ